MNGAPAVFGRLGDTPERDYRSRLQLFNAFAEPELRAAIASLQVAPGMRVLDAGCGTGATLGWLAAAAEPGGLVLGADLSAPHLQAARGQLTPNALLLQTDLQRPPFAAGSFDLVWSANTVHHLTDPVRGIRTLASLLRPSGRVAIGQSSLLPDMHFAWDARLERVTTEAVRAYYRDRYRISEHALTSVRGVAGLLQAAGLSNLSVRTYLIERLAPLDAKTQAWLLEVIFRGTWGERLRPYLETADFAELTQLCDPRHARFALHRPDFHLLQSFTLAVGERSRDR